MGDADEALDGGDVGALSLFGGAVQDLLFPFAILRTKGSAAANATQRIAFAGLLSMFFFLTLLHAERPRPHPDPERLRLSAVTAGIILAGVSSQLIPRIGTRPIVVAGTMIAAAGRYHLSRVPVHGSYLSDLLPGLAVVSIGLGAVTVTVTAAANAGVPAHQAGLVTAT